MIHVGSQRPTRFALSSPLITRDDIAKTVALEFYSEHLRSCDSISAAHCFFAERGGRLVGQRCTTASISASLAFA